VPFIDVDVMERTIYQIIATLIVASSKFWIGWILQGIRIYKERRDIPVSINFTWSMAVKILLILTFFVVVSISATVIAIYASVSSLVPSVERAKNHSLMIDTFIVHQISHDSIINVRLENIEKKIK